MPDSRWEPHPISALASSGVAIPWVWNGYLARGHVTNLSGYPKVGKSTFLSHLLVALGGQARDFCGLSLGQARCLVVTEEHERLWARRRDDLGIGDHVAIIDRPFLKRPDLQMWRGFLQHLAGAVKQHGYALVVLDSLPALWSAQDENDAALVIENLMPLTAITEASAAVLLLTHPPKQDTTQGRATRGSGALTAFVDVIIEMRREDSDDPANTRRVVTAYSRFDETPRELVIELDPDNGYRALGTRAGLRAKEDFQEIAACLPDGPPGITAEELAPRTVPNENSRLTVLRARRILRQSAEQGLVARTGDGRRGNPFRYYLTSASGDMDTLPIPLQQAPAVKADVPTIIRRLSGNGAGTEG